MTYNERLACLNGLRYLLNDYEVPKHFRHSIEERFDEFITGHIDEGADPVTGCAFEPSGLKSSTKNGK